MAGFLDQLGELVGRYPYDEAFIEKLRQRIIRDGSKVPVHIHRRAQAQNRLVLAARESIVMHFDEAFEDAWFPFTLRPGWPIATCIITTTKGKSTAHIEFSFGPETDGERGGQEIEPVEFPVLLSKPNIFSRAFRAFEKRDLKAERQPETAPVGTPDGRPELKLKAAVKSSPAKPAPPKPIPQQSAEKPAPIRRAQAKKL